MAATLESLAELSNWNTYREFMRERLKQPIPPDSSFLLSKEKIDFVVDGKAWRGIAVLVGPKGLAAVKKIKKEGVLFREGTCRLDGKQFVVVGLEAQPLKRAQLTLKKLKLGYSIAGVADGADEDEEAGTGADASNARLAALVAEIKRHAGRRDPASAKSLAEATRLAKEAGRISSTDPTRADALIDQIAVLLEGVAIVGATASGTEQPGFKEQGWVRGSKTIAKTPTHVGSIFFKTKDSAIDSRDDGLLHQLAKEYGEFVRERSKVAGGKRGLVGRVVGYADPRRSKGPDNPKLSGDRATIVARLLTRYLAAESGSIEGDFDIEVVAGGEVPGGSGTGANVLAPLRRADIYLEGGIVAKAPVVPPPAKKQAPPEPPPLDEIEHDWDRYDVYVDKVHKESIYGIATRMWSVLAVGAAAKGDKMGEAGVVSAYWTAIGLYIDLHHRERRSEFPAKIDSKKPTWWDGLHKPQRIQPGQTAGQAVLQDKARQLKTWYLTTIKFGDTYIRGKGKVLDAANREIRRDHPDAKKMWAYARPSEEYMYMIEVTADLAREVMKLAQD